jgi:hypothetical protein
MQHSRVMRTALGNIAKARTSAGVVWVEPLIASE